QSGRPVHFSTTGLEGDAGRPHPLQLASQNVDVAANVLTCDAGTGASGIVEESLVAEELQALPDDQLLSQAAREAAITTISILREMAYQKTQLVADRQAERGAGAGTDEIA